MRKIYLMLALLLTCAATAWADLASDITNAKTIAGLCKTKNPTQSSTAIDNAISALDATGGGVQANYDALVEAIKAFNKDAAVKVLSFIDGLPGTATNNNTQKAYTYEGSELHFASAAQVLRFTVYDTNTHAKYPDNDSGHKFFTLSEIGITGKNTGDEAYKNVTPSNAWCINTNASQRVLGAAGHREGYVGALIDGSTQAANFFHSQWDGTAVNADHYLDFLVSEACTDFQFSFTSRNNSNVPSVIFVEARPYTAPTYTVSCTQEGGGLVYNNTTYTNGQQFTITNALPERMTDHFNATMSTIFAPAEVNGYIGMSSALSTNGTNTFYVDYYDRWHKYYIRHANKTGYAQPGYYLKQDDAGTGLDYIENANDKCYFIFEPGSEPNTLLIKAPNGKYVQAYVADQAKIALANTKANYTIKRETADEFVIFDPDINNDHIYLHMNGNNKVVGWNEGPGNSHWMQPEVTEVEVPKPSSHPFRLTDALGNVYEGSMLVQGDTYTLPDLGVIGLTRSNEQTGDDGTFTADITFPFPISDATHTNWTYIKYAYATPLFWYVQDGDVNIHTSGTSLNKQPTLGDYTLYHFAIYPQYNTADQKFTFKVKNENKGKYLYSSANGANIEVNKDADEATLLSFQDVGNGRNNFVLPGNTHAISSDTNTGVTTLHSLAIATTNTGHLGFKAVFEEAPDFTALEAALQAAADYTIGTGMGQYSVANEETWTAAAAEAKAAHNNWTAAQITEKTTALTTPAPTLNMPASGFYRFIGDSHSKRDSKNYYMCTLGTPNSQLNYKDQADAYTIFYYDAESNEANNWTHNITTYEGGFNLTDDETGNCTSVKNYVIDAAPTKGLYRIHYNTGTYLVDWGNSDIQTTTEATNDWIGWQIEAVEELPLTIKATGYTTFSAPVAVTIPAGVTAYAVSAIGESSVTLTEVSGNVQAQTGLILYKENGGDITLPIAASGNAVAGNQLHENWKAHSFTADCGQYYLGTTGGQTGFYKQSAEGILAGHKAYLPAQSAAVKAFLGFGFDTATGIEALDAQQSVTIYDLSGRQLPRLQKGVNIVNGKKVIVK